MNHLLHPELISSMPLIGGSMAKMLEERSTARDLAAYERVEPEKPVTVVARTLNEASKLEAFFNDISSQKFTGEIELVVIDNESTDETDSIARSHGATVRSIKRKDFSHPRSLNMAMETASHENVFVASGHILLATNQTLRAGSMHLEAGAAGAYAWPPLPNSNASAVEAIGIQALSGRLRNYHLEQKARWGILSMAGSMLSRNAWQSTGGFNEKFGAGGEDSDLAEKLLSSNEVIVFDPVMAIHHTHGLSLQNRLHRTYTLARSRAGHGTEFDRSKMAKIRPDLLINE